MKQRNNSLSESYNREYDGKKSELPIKRFKTVDLFSGCGGMSLGFMNAGFDVIAAFDNWKPAVDVYRKNFNHPIYQEDLTDETTQAKIKGLSPNIIIGGPPCQDFSSAGHRNVNLGRAVLTATYCDIITRVMPEYFVMENVPEITKSEILGKILERFSKTGYGLTSMILDASLCGVPQSRKRYVLVGCLGAADGFLQKYLEANLAEKPMTMFDYLGDSLGVECYFRVPRSYNRRGVFSIYEPCQTIRGVDRPIPSGYKGHPSDPVEIGPKVRALTILERSYVQTFPKTFVFEGTKSNLNQMIGNAVPVKLAEHIGLAIIAYDKTRGE
ncbi:DNA cytosine methyltransferase [Aminivibrio sp.]|uniref:DNA cytosine methyltransferase n=1 Tax=Aminivibrio sp. TaxID=1872489 RepID=UPI001A4F06C2|nr:DNA cytosine methyltransferase [Aminivibrio sp.]MBL3539238.1 DNA cytosine methyltransferase [Aminivibrio sp.]